MVKDSKSMKEARVKGTCLEYGIENKEVLSQEFLETSIPTAPKRLAVLCEIWKKPCNIDKLSKMSNQSAAHIRDLKDAGYKLKMNKTQRVFTGQDGNKYREVIGWEKPKTTTPSTYVKISDKDKCAFLKGKRDPYTGIKNDLEFDHRTPTTVSMDMFGEVPAILTSEMLNNGEADKLFQLLTRSMNAKKREVCKKCINGGIIADTLPVLPKKLNNYKKKFDALCHLTKSCAGCYWYDPEITQNDAINEYVINSAYNKYICL